MALATAKISIYGVFDCTKDVGDGKKNSNSRGEFLAAAPLTCGEDHRSGSSLPVAPPAAMLAALHDSFKKEKYFEFFYCFPSISG